MSRLLVLGAGGHGRVVADAALATGIWTEVCFLDDARPEVSHLGAVVGPLSIEEFAWRKGDVAVPAIGENSLRLALCERAAAAGVELATVIHPSATVGRAVRLGPGSVILAQAAVNTGAEMGIGCIVNTGSCVEHDCRIDDGVHVAPGAHIAGGVRIGARAWIGIGSAIRENISIGSDAVIGAGAAVVESVAPGTKVGGVPAVVLQ